MRVWLTPGSIGYSKHKDILKVVVSWEQKIYPKSRFVMSHFQNEVWDIICILKHWNQVLAQSKWISDMRMNDSPRYWETQHITANFWITEEITKILWKE